MTVRMGPDQSTSPVVFLGMEMRGDWNAMVVGGGGQGVVIPGIGERDLRTAHGTRPNTIQCSIDCCNKQNAAIV